MSSASRNNTLISAAAVLLAGAAAGYLLHRRLSSPRWIDPAFAAALLTVGQNEPIALNEAAAYRLSAWLKAHAHRWGKPLFTPPPVVDRHILLGYADGRQVDLSFHPGNCLIARSLDKRRKTALCIVSTEEIASLDVPILMS